MDLITKEHSTNTPYHVFTLFRIASVNNLAGKVINNEEIYERIAEMAPMAYPENSLSLFHCHDALLKYYLNFDVDKC